MAFRSFSIGILGVPWSRTCSEPRFSGSIHADHFTGGDSGWLDPIRGTSLATRTARDPGAMRGLEGLRDFWIEMEGVFVDLMMVTIDIPLI